MTVCYRLRYLSCLPGKEGTPFRTTFLFRLKRFLSISDTSLSIYQPLVALHRISWLLQFVSYPLSPLGLLFFEYLPELQVEGNEHLLFSCLYFIKFVIENANYIML